MRWLWIAVITAGVMTLASASQENESAKPISSEKASSDSPSAGLVGTDLVAELNHSVDAKKVKLGDLVKATVTQDVLLRGKIVIGRGSKLVGHVTQTKRWNKNDQESHLGMVFDKAVLKNGGQIDFVAAVRAVAPGIRADLVDRPDGMMPMGAVGQGTPQPMNGGASRTRGPNGSSNTTNSTNNNGNQAAQASRLSTDTPVSTSGNNASPNYGVMGGGSRGVFGLPGLHLNSGPGGQGSVFSSTSHNVRLDSGTQMVIQVNNVAR